MSTPQPQSQHIKPPEARNSCHESEQKKSFCLLTVDRSTKFLFSWWCEQRDVNENKRPAHSNRTANKWPLKTSSKPTVGVTVGSLHVLTLYPPPSPPILIRSRTVFLSFKNETRYVIVTGTITVLQHLQVEDPRSRDGNGMPKSFQTISEKNTKFIQHLQNQFRVLDLQWMLDRMNTISLDWCPFQ